jgi:inhibitor of KinA sporulation pathway (predicted exonuclease)
MTKTKGASMIIFDLEYTTWKGSLERDWSMDWEFREIIQIGALSINSRTLIPISDFTILVKPDINPTLSDYCVNLTGISQRDLNSDGVNLDEGLQKFKDFCGSANKIYSYGRDDIVIKDNLKIRNMEFHEDFNFLDLCPIFEREGINTALITSGDLHKEFLISPDTFPFKRHHALFDCYSIASSLKFLLMAEDKDHKPVL